MRFELPALPYDQNALEPWISERTVGFHYDKHHRGYLEKLEASLEKDLRDLPLEQIVRRTKGDVYNFAAQVFNHNFYWASLTPASSSPRGALEELIERSFGGLDQLYEQFCECATGEFGSGWAWLVVDAAGKLTTISTTDADNPIPMDVTPLLTLDVWEHAYYLDYQHERGKYLKACLDHLMNWDFAADNLERCKRVA
jgi:Fe-Mn family superoxide dismutase